MNFSSNPRVAPKSSRATWKWTSPSVLQCQPLKYSLTLRRFLMSSGSLAGWRAFPLQLSFPLTPVFPDSSTDVCTSTWQRRHGPYSHCHTCSADKSAQAFCVGTEQHRTFSQHFPTQTSGMNKQFHLTCSAQEGSPTNRQDICNCYPYLQHSTKQERSVKESLAQGCPSRALPATTSH